MLQQHPGVGVVPSPHPGIMPHAVPPGGGMLGVPPHMQPQQPQQQPAAAPEPQPEPVSSLAFPPGLLPQLCRDKSKYSDAYASIEPAEIDKAGLPPPPEKDAYLKSRMDKFMLEVRAWLLLGVYVRGVELLSGGGCLYVVLAAEFAGGGAFGGGTQTGVLA